MGAKQSAETKEAIRLHKGGLSISGAARRAGIFPSTLHRALVRARKANAAKSAPLRRSKKRA